MKNSPESALMKTNRIAILGGKRTPFARSFTQYMGLSNQDLMTHAVKSLVEHFDLKGERLGEVAGGSVLKHTSDWNLTREVVLGSGLSAETPAFDIVQACGTSLAAAIAIGNKIAMGQIEVGIAAGADTNSDIPFVFSKTFNHTMLESQKSKGLFNKLKLFSRLRPKDVLPQMPTIVEPRTRLSMGQSCEKMAQEWKISREDQDQLAFESHTKATAAVQNGFYQDLITPFHGLSVDNNVRADTSLDKLRRLKPAFDRSEKGTLTAGNSSALTDGSSAVLLSSESWARERSLPVLAYLTHCEVAAVDFVGGEGLLMAPTYAVSRMLEKAKLSLQDFDFYEIHEAFAAQVLCTLRAWESEEFCRQRLKRSHALGSLPRKSMNVHGGSVALGHPFAATGARILATLAKTLHQSGEGKRGLISICTGGGMGVTAILEGAGS